MRGGCCESKTPALRVLQLVLHPFCIPWIREISNAGSGKDLRDFHPMGLGPPKALLEEGALERGTWNTGVLEIGTKGC